MVKLIDLLREVGEASAKPYEWRQTSDEYSFKDYMFKTDSGLNYKVDIDVMESDEERDTAVIKFGIVDEEDDYFTDYDETPSRGELFKVMATVVEIIKDFIKENEYIKYLHFTTDKVGPGETKRLGLYKQYIKKHIPNADVETKNRYGAEVTTVTLKEVGEASSKPYNWKQTADSEDYKEYMFQTKSGFYYKVEIEVLEGDSAFVQFGIVEPDEDNMGFTNFDAVPSRGDLFNIMATVVEVLKDLIKKNPNIKYLQFETTKGRGKESNARLNLYAKYIQKHLPNATISTDSKRGYEMTSIKLKEIGDASAKAYKFEKVYDDEFERTYGFETDSGQMYNVVIEEIDPEDPFTAGGGVRLDIRFYAVGEDPDAEEYDKVLNKGELYKVMATIVDIIRFEMKQRPYIKAISFKPSKRKSQDKARLELYKRFLKNFYPNTEYETYGDEVIAILKK